MTIGLRRNKMNYKEIYSRIGSKFYEVENNDSHDVYAICMAKGLTDKAGISEVIKDAETCDYDLRRVIKAIHVIQVRRQKEFEKNQREGIKDESTDL